MNKEQINRIIQDNELFHGMMGLGVVMDANHLEKFAKLVAAEEREACAKVCDELVLEHPGRADLTAKQCAFAIKKRGNNGQT
jgi:hypothetical protein